MRSRHNFLHGGPVLADDRPRAVGLTFLVPRLRLRIVFIASKGARAQQLSSVDARAWTAVRPLSRRQGLASRP